MKDTFLTGLPFLWSIAYLTVWILLLLKHGLAGRQTRLVSSFLVVWTIANGLVGVIQGTSNLLDERVLTYERIQAYAILVSSVLFLNQIRMSLSTRTRTGDWFWWGLGIAWLALYTLADIFLASSIPYAPQTTLWAGWALFMARAVLLLTRVFQKTPHALARRQLLYWAVIFGLIGAGYLLGLAQLGDWAQPCLWIGATVLAIVVSLPQLPDFLRTAGTVLSSLVLVVFAASLYAFVWAALYWVRSPLLETAPWLPGAVLTVVLVVLFIPIWTLTRQIVGRLFPSPHFDTNRILREYSLSISNILDPQRLASAAVGLISEAIEVQRGILILVYREQVGELNAYRLSGTTGMGVQIPSADGVLANDGLLAHYFSKEHRHLTQYDIDFSPHFAAVPTEEHRWFADLQMDLYMPIYAKDDWIGLLALGSKALGQPYTEEDLLLLRILADQTAVALQNARLVESLMRVNNDFRRAYTALEQSNRQLGRANAQLEKLDRAQSDFIAIASHELRTPLTVMRGYTEMLQDDPLVTGNSYYKKLVNVIHSGIMRFHEIVDGMLDIAMIDNSALNLNLGDVSIDVLIRLITNGLREAANERRIAINVENLQGLPPIAGDPEALRKVFSHLIINAIKYTPDGGNVTISGRLVPAGQNNNLGGDALEIVVADTGIGIAREYQDLIFAKFYQTGEIALHSSGKTKFKGGGPGLGLTIAKGIVEAHGGRIWVESPGYSEEKCPGSKFFIMLPLRPGK